MNRTQTGRQMKGNISSHMTVLKQFLLSESLGWDSSDLASRVDSPHLNWASFVLEDTSQLGTEAPVIVNL